LRTIFSPAGNEGQDTGGIVAFVMGFYETFIYSLLHMKTRRSVAFPCTRPSRS